MLTVILAVTSWSVASALRCYSCVSSLPASTPVDAQHAFKSILYSAYNLPPVSKWCSQSDSVDFKTIPQEECSSGDHCMKIAVKEQGLSFVMRGCQSALYRDGITSTPLDCSNERSPSMCRCTEPLCNASATLSLLPLVTLLSLVFVLQCIFLL